MKLKFYSAWGREARPGRFFRHKLRHRPGPVQPELAHSHHWEFRLSLRPLKTGGGVNSNIAETFLLKHFSEYWSYKWWPLASPSSLQYPRRCLGICSIQYCSSNFTHRHAAIINADAENILKNNHIYTSLYRRIDAHHQSLTRRVHLNSKNLTTW